MSAALLGPLVWWSCYRVVDRTPTDVVVVDEGAGPELVTTRFETIIHFTDWAGDGRCPALERKEVFACGFPIPPTWNDEDAQPGGWVLSEKASRTRPTSDVCPACLEAVSHRAEVAP